MLGTEYDYPEWSLYVGYAMTASSILCIPIYIVYKFAVTPGSVVQVIFLFKITTTLFSYIKKIVHFGSNECAFSFTHNFQFPLIGTSELNKLFEALVLLLFLSVVSLSTRRLLICFNF